MNEKKICPLTGQSCVEAKCAWWATPEGWDPGNCSIPIIAAELSFVSGDTETIGYRLYEAQDGVLLT